MKRRIACALAGVLSLEASVAGLPSRVRADDGARPASVIEGRVADARRAYADLDYPGAVAAAEAVVADEAATALDRARALETLGWAHVVLGHEAAARDAFARLFALDPYWPIAEPSGAPRIARLGEAVRAERVRDAALDPRVTLHLEVPRAARVGRESSVEVRADGAPAGAHVELYVRGAADGAWDVLAADAREGRYVGVVAARAAPDVLELYARMRDREGRVVASAAGPLDPRELPVEAPDATPDEALWLGLGLGGGALAVGAAIAAVVWLAGPDAAPEGTLPPGRVELPLAIP